MVTVDEFRDLSIQKVKAACEQFWLHRNATLFTEHLYGKNPVVMGMDCQNADGIYKIEMAEYKDFLQDDTTCVVTAKLLIYDSKRLFVLQENAEAMVTCVLEEDEIYFSTVHMSVRHHNVYQIKDVKTPSFYYKKLMNSMADLVIETKAEEPYFSYDKEKYFKIFGETPTFRDMDDWFWHLCEELVLPQDLEKLDLFRESDLTKRIQNEDLIIETIFRIQRHDGEILWLHMHIVFILDLRGESIGDVFIMIDDCTKEMTEKMNNLEFARTDYLTHIWNRRYTEELINEKLEKREQGIFVLFDVDKFKTINDSYGHLTGDDLLVRISLNVSKELDSDDVFGRLGGDEFVLWLKRGNSLLEDKQRILRIYEATRFLYQERDVEMNINCSAGAIFTHDKESTFDTLYKKADEAMYEAKRAGRNNIVIK